MKDSIRHEEVVMSGQYSKVEAGVWRLEAGGWGLEAGGWRLKVGSEVANGDLTATLINDL
jgi:hypothetical protein